MSNKQKNWLTDRNKIKKWITKNKAADVIIFGSSVKGKMQPGDIDLCIIINEDKQDNIFDLIDSLAKELKDARYHITYITEKDFLSGSGISKTLLSEGFSMSRNKPVTELFGFRQCSIFIYGLKDFSSSKRVRFHYLLQGRNKEKGILKMVNGQILGAGVIVVPTAKEDELAETFKMWGIKFRIRQGLLES